jgi:Na+/proline symporter
LIALSSLIVFPELADIQRAFPNLSADKLGHDVAYPAMLTLLPSGLLGLVAASLIAAFMSTMSTQLNLGASYLVNDFYHRFINKNASEKQLVQIGRLFTVLSIILGGGLGLMLTSAGQAFTLLLMIGAGTGLIYILRWFWWRINAYTEIVAMVSSIIIAGYFNFGESSLEGWQKIVIGAFLTTIVWVVATYFTPPDDEVTLRNFVKKVNPGGPGWVKYSDDISGKPWPVPKGILSMVLGCMAVYGFLLGVGQLIYGQTGSGLLICGLGTASSYGLLKLWK